MNDDELRALLYGDIPIAAPPSRPYDGAAAPPVFRAQTTAIDPAWLVIAALVAVALFARTR